MSQMRPANPVMAPNTARIWHGALASSLGTRRCCGHPSGSQIGVARGQRIPVVVFNHGRHDVANDACVSAITQFDGPLIEFDDGLRSKR